ncbi:gemin 2 [Brevipalpus obovatus]|uniref:gemin 2 n=1 Tax=Brevipalpus obovatus TaxID=246614 RepID=UPI003D9F17D3
MTIRIKSFNIDEEAEILKPILPVSSGNSDLSRPPADGADYLKRVRSEAEKYPKFVTADIELEDSLEDTEVDSFQLEDRFLPADRSTITSIEWRKCVINQFVKARKRVDLERCKGIIDEKLKSSLPKATNLHQWRKVIGSTHNPAMNTSGTREIYNRASESEDEDAGEEKTKPATQTQTHQELSPKLSVMLLLPQSLIVDILEGLIDWIREEGYSHRLGMWTYSLLACIEEPLQPDYFDILRRLSRTCSFIRSKHDLIQDKSLISSLNVIITLIGIYFNQKDLQDPTVLDEIE